MDEEVSTDSTEEAERLVCWACKVSLVDLQREIFLKVHALKKEREQERISLKEVSSLKPLRQGISLTAQIQQSIDMKTGMYLHPLKSIKNWKVN